MAMRMDKMCYLHVKGVTDMSEFKKYKSGWMVEKSYKFSNCEDAIQAQQVLIDITRNNTDEYWASEYSTVKEPDIAHFAKAHKFLED